MKLPYGVTGGYYKPVLEKEPPCIDEKGFYRTCKEIAAKKHLKCEIIHDLFCSSYCAVKFNYQPRPIYVLCNRAHPFIGFCLFESLGEGHVFHWDQFIDFEELEREFKSDYYVLSVEELSKPFQLQEHEELRTVSSIIEQVNYYQPRTIGEAIFNAWD
ncbi:hypothetical protein [Alkalihalobacterium chitinilyticum]|uniref:Uncharacterized protein n=1 Tax=Alkalihalobacterium chitinilyticum TaxID=2980103 RepID=A0ABT5VI32_9BACI|nr:hypothetical protein [Alkalihalobacterium chitinilyticum]MDE5415117.1 hypothetical protein [Alkalihalobacterium chitinilyticum]